MPPSDSLSCHRLIHYPDIHGLSDTTSGEAMVLLESMSAALPFGWLFLFGSRNIWEPGESVEARGGAAGRRDPGVTPMDVAQVRLQEAYSALANDSALGPVCTPLSLLLRVIESAGDRGQIRLQSPPSAFGKKADADEKRRLFLQYVAIAENVVYHLGRPGRGTVGKALESLRAFCDFVPSGDPALDWAALQKAGKKIAGGVSKDEIPVRLMVGWPPGSRMQGVFAGEAVGIAAALERAARQATASPKLRASAGTGAGGSNPPRPWWAFWRR